MRKEEISKPIDVGKYLGLGRKMEVSDHYGWIIFFNSQFVQFGQLFIIDVTPHYNTLVSNTEVPHISGEDIPFNDVRKIFILY